MGNAFAIFDNHELRHHESIKHFVDILDAETLVRTLATHNMFGQRPVDLAQVTLRS